tara:strand:+ start:725 stop:1024 length:300 start_codon:yes stop_codon:yes gene_type:complete
MGNQKNTKWSAGWWKLQRELLSQKPNRNQKARKNRTPSRGLQKEMPQVQEEAVNADAVVEDSVSPVEDEQGLKEVEKKPPQKKKRVYKRKSSKKKSQDS